MILAHHAIFSTYGFWLPNDPRGSWSDYVGAYELYRFGPATKTNETRSVAHIEHDRDARLNAKLSLKRRAVRFNAEQIECVAQGFGQAIEESSYVVLACAIMRDHVHMVIKRGFRPIGQIVGHLKARASQALVAHHLHPFEHERKPTGELPTVWVAQGWNVFLNSRDDVVNAMAYVKGNPSKSGLPDQKWAFVQAYVD